MTVDPFADLPRKHFGALMVDPPWHFKVRTESGKGRSPEGHYSVMSLDDIKALPVRDLTLPDCHLFMWVTGPILPAAFGVIADWGFRYSSVAFTWIKLKRSFNPAQLRVLPSAEQDLHVGLGFTTRKNAEFCLLARRGNAKRISKSVREIIMAPVREHSRKPDEAYERVQQYCAGPYLELFARTQRDGWTGWGNETQKFARAA